MHTDRTPFGCDTATLVMILDVEDRGTRFSWKGGAYIEVGVIPAGEDFGAIEVVNVWDYELGVLAIPTTLDGFTAACGEWLRERDADEQPEPIALQVDVRKGLPSLTLYVNGEHQAWATVSEVVAELRELDACPMRRVTVSVRECCDADAATLAVWISPYTAA